MKLVVPLAALALVGCAAPQSPATRSAAAPGYTVVAQATDLQGTRVGPLPADKKATLMVVFASWCGPCRHELATLGELRAKRPELRIIGLNAYEEWGEMSDARRLQGFLAQNAPWLRVVHADQKLLRHFGGVRKIPTVFVFDGSGRLVREFRRAMRAPPTLDELEAVVSEALIASN
jgi:thiol-disulfide isomerase/thioredoxin